ncbi:hypothetical protein [Spiroplasma sp. BIUS-1]|uniref:hypothetical protein n=1 Tax=Spiroplasma sp. BIUS-1 TaxID=216964 RepID=UPI001398F5D3|nr:hypothetical protein [Spiroplasma sp. BIUS-1]QHX36796.1 ABC transporter permease [Spiroplasma sp. BIUS-1]
MYDKKISNYIVFKFQVKNLLSDKSLIIMSFISIFFTLALAFALLFIDSSDTKVIIFNYYVLINVSVITIINILKTSIFLFNQKREDKTLNFMVAQNLPRTRIFFTTLVVITSNNFFLSLINYIILNLIDFLSSMNFDHVILRITTVYLVYSFLITILLTNFIVFLIFMVNTQITTIVMTLIVSFGFISSLPYQFLTSSENIKNLTFTSSQNTSSLQRVSDIYDAFNFQKYVKLGKFAYPNLSKFINNEFIKKENQFRTSSFNSEENINKRIEIWKKLGIINELNIEIFIEDVELSSVRIDSELRSWQTGDKIELHAILKNTFISMQQLDNLIKNNPNNPNLNVLIELNDFSNYLMKYFNEFQSKFYNLFDDFIFFGSCEIEYSCNSSFPNGYIKNKTRQEIFSLQKEYLIDIYQNSFVVLNGLTLSYSQINKIISTDMSKGGFFNPLMITIRVLENYFIKYTSNYILATTYKVETNSQNWKEYKSSRDSYNLFFYFNFISNVLINYTYFSGFSYDDFWFDPNYISKISFDTQENIFLPYVTYTFKLDENNIIEADTYNNFTPVYYYLIFQLVFLAITNRVSHYKFKKLDIN